MQPNPFIFSFLLVETQRNYNLSEVYNAFRWHYFPSLVQGRLCLAFSQFPKNQYNNCAICSKEGSYSSVEYFSISKIQQNTSLKIKEMYLLHQCLHGFHSLRRANAGLVSSASVKCWSLGWILKVWVSVESLRRGSVGVPESLSECQQIWKYF